MLSCPAATHRAGRCQGSCRRAPARSKHINLACLWSRTYFLQDLCASQEPLHHINIVTVSMQKVVVCCVLFYCTFISAHLLCKTSTARNPSLLFCLLISCRAIWQRADASVAIPPCCHSRSHRTTMSAEVTPFSVKSASLQCLFMHLSCNTSNRAVSAGLE